MEGETNTPEQSGTDNAQPSTREYTPDPDFDGPLDGTPEENEGAEELNGETDAGETAQESDTSEPDEAQEATSESDDGVLEVPMTSKVKLPDGNTMTIDELRKGYLRQDDYTRKQQEASTTYKAKVSEIGALSTRLESTIDVISDFLMKSVPEAPDPSLAFTDPSRHYRENIAHQSAMEQVQRLIQLGSTPKEVKAALDENQTKELIANETAALHRALPKLAKPEAKEAFFKQAIDVGQKLGFDAKEIQNMTDHRFFMLADLAIEGMAARDAKKVAKTKVANVPPMAPQRRPANIGSNPNRDVLASARKNGGMTMAEAARLVGDFD
jgi:hypothetical protein